ncbi:glycosyltransferase [Patescibacteria group bacterium]|nr:glycosyltransferase [Patescibacteria group bacterium]
MLSIIIPTLNEEKLLSKLLASIKKQSFSDLEIIVADAGSRDRTVEIVNQYGAKVVPGGLPARGRNEGAKAAQGKLLLFLDADTEFEEDVFSDMLEEFFVRGLGVASFFLGLRKKNHQIGFNVAYNWPVRIFERILPHGAMGILVKREIFDTVGGFDETIKLAEDHHFVREAAKLAKFGFFRSTKLIVSPRRFQIDGWIKTYLKFIAAELHMVFLGPIRTDIFKYRFDHYSKKQ